MQLMNMHAFGHATIGGHHDGMDENMVRMHDKMPAILLMRQDGSATSPLQPFTMCHVPQKQSFVLTLQTLILIRQNFVLCFQSLDLMAF